MTKKMGCMDTNGTVHTRWRWWLLNTITMIKYNCTGTETCETRRFSRGILRVTVRFLFHVNLVFRSPSCGKVMFLVMFVILSTERENSHVTTTWTWSNLLTWGQTGPALESLPGASSHLSPPYRTGTPAAKQAAFLLEIILLWNCLDQRNSRCADEPEPEAVHWPRCSARQGLSCDSSQLSGRRDRPVLAEDLRVWGPWYHQLPGR